MAIDFSFLEGVAPKQEEAPKKTDMANVTIRVDADSMLLCDGEYMDQQFKAGIITKIQLPTGQHLLEFLSEENPDVKVEKVVDFIEAGKSYLVIVNELKAALSKFHADTAVALGTQKAYRLTITGYANQISAMMVARTIMGWSAAESQEKLAQLPVAVIDSQDLARVEAIAAQFAKGGVNVSVETRNGLGELVDVAKLKTYEEIEKETKMKAEEEAERKRYEADVCIVPEGVEVIDNRHEFFKKYYNGESRIVMPSTLKRLGVEELDYKAKMMMDVTPAGHDPNPNVGLFSEPGVENKIKEIDMSRCTNLALIGEYAFYCCDKLSKLSLPDSVREIKDHAFDQCVSLEEIEIPRQIDRIGEWAFSGCKKIRKVHFKNCVGVSIGDGAFCGCENLEHINIDSCVEFDERCSYVFKRCKRLTLPSAVIEKLNK